APPDADPWLVGHLRRWAYLPGDPAAPITTDDPITPYQLEIRGEWQAAAEAWTARSCPYDAAIAQLRGDISAVETALATFRRLGASAAARRAQQRLNDMRGHTPSQHTDTSADPHGLTSRQRDILELLAVGHSDADIANALGISPRTVSTHVGAILTKLGVHNRTQAAVYARQQPRSHN
ncbi:MAG: helix-turn-helix transcriptional regulator, partial [Mycobacterium sp.]|uniref:helix-turn-helix transcriptional regulator n=1 Tax=Mycobacterium sp. TaxID=1785 RepID=UPI003BB15230